METKTKKNNKRTAITQKRAWPTIAKQLVWQNKIRCRKWQQWTQPPDRLIKVTGPVDGGCRVQKNGIRIYWQHDEDQWGYPIMKNILLWPSLVQRLVLVVHAEDFTSKNGTFVGRTELRILGEEVERAGHRFSLQKDYGNWMTIIWLLCYINSLIILFCFELRKQGLIFILRSN